MKCQIYEKCTYMASILNAPIPCPVNWNSDGTTHKRFEREPMFRFVESTYIESTFDMQAKIKIFAFWENPTCVGKTRSTSSSDSSRKEQGQGHPHMRGEDSRFHKRGHACRGTSPHAWGRHVGKELKERQYGNIPTCVGKTKVANAKGILIREHPHMRGEDTKNVK